MKIYRDNIKTYDDDLLSISRQLNRFSLLRLLVFVCSCAVLITLFSLNQIAAAFIILPFLIVGFAFVVRRHDKIAHLKNHSVFLKEINESEIQREECNLGEFEAADEFIDPTHAYASDLDVFGQHSIFQLVNRATTESGKLLLSEWLLKPASNSEIRERQEATKELVPKLDWRQDFQASGMHYQNKKSDYAKLLDWVQQPIVLRPKRIAYIAVVLVLPVLFFLGLYLFYANLPARHSIFYLGLVLSVVIINQIILGRLRPIAENIVETSSENLSTLRGYRALIHKIEKEDFTSKKLQRIQSKLQEGDHSVCKEIDKICSLLDFSHQRPIKKIPIGGNYMYPLLNTFFLLDIYLILGTEKWKSKNKAYLQSWAEVVSEFEVINSFAGFGYSNPTYAFPKISEKSQFVNFEALGHPLLPAKNRICNDFKSDGAGDVVMITGSNMGGKSTFLRTVGVNLVLALAGAPCCATKGEVSNLDLFTSMRTQDNLMTGVSSFYAELNRIEKMLKLIENNQNIYFLLDEMFKGTNSEDRYKGGLSLINQLSKLKTSGIIATHDIELAKLSGNKKLVTNYSFNSVIKDNLMIFSYSLDPFICTDFNASELMKRSGIEILSNVTMNDIEG